MEGASIATSMNILKTAHEAAAPQMATQQLVVESVAILRDDTRCYTLKSASGQPLAGFTAGCSIPVIVEANGREIACPYPISSSPREAGLGMYEIVVRRSAGGYASKRILDSWREGDAVVVGTPQDDGASELLRGGGTIVGIAAGMGIVPFHSMARAIAEGNADYRLVLLYQAEAPNEILFRDEWKTLEAKSRGRLTVVPVMRAEAADGSDGGLITCDFVKQQADLSEAAVLICGPGSMVASLRKELSALGLPRRRLRFFFSGDSEYAPHEESAATHQLTIRIAGESHTIPAREDETILEAIEKAGLQPAAYCRSSICGYCESMLRSGMFVLATDTQGVRTMRERNSLVHPCCAYPRSDMELVVQRAKA